MFVPTTALQPMVQRWVNGRAEDPTIACVTLAEKTKLVDDGRGVSYDLIYRIYAGRHHETVRYESADAIVCAMGLGLYAWLGALKEWYLPLPVCANPRCGKVIDRPDRGSRTGRNMRYCSAKCRTAGGRIERGERPAPGEMATLVCEFCEREYQIERSVGGGAYTRRRACDDIKCKRALKAALMRDYREKKRAA